MPYVLAVLLNDGFDESQIATLGGDRRRNKILLQKMHHTSTAKSGTFYVLDKPKTYRRQEKIARNNFNSYHPSQWR